MKLLIKGQWQDTERVLEVLNPYDNSVIDTVPKATADLVREALGFANSYGYRLTAWERYEIISKVAKRIEAEADELAQLIAKESGKTIKDAYTEIKRSVQTFIFSAEEAKRINGEVVPIDAVEGMPKSLGLAIREPLGVIVAICPFNYPLNLVAHKVGPALAANNPVIVKPSSSTPLTALKMAEYFLEAGLPEEMLQVLVGDSSEIGDCLIANSIVRKVTFTGSVTVGQYIASKMGLQHCCMELGGNDPLLILEDADLDKALPIVIDGAFGNNGERCTSIKRIIIEDKIADNFIGRVAEEAGSLKVGDQLNPATYIGPLIDEASAKEVDERVSDAVDRGAKLLVGGKREGALYWPTVLDHVAADWPVVVEETFGPVAPFIRVNSLDEAIDVANSTPFGLQSGVLTRDYDKAMEAVRRIQSGAVMINRGPGFRAEHLPFGGIKESGLGREGVKYAVQSMTNLKTVVL